MNVLKEMNTEGEPEFVKDAEGAKLARMGGIHFVNWQMSSVRFIELEKYVLPIGKNLKQD